MKSIYCCGIIVMLAGAVQAQLMYGTITDAVTGRPVAGALITITELSEVCSTDSAGKYSTKIIPAGIFHAVISARDYLPSRKKVFIAAPKGPGISRMRINTRLYHISSVADTALRKVSLTYRFAVHGEVEIVIKNAVGKIVRKMYDRTRAGGVRRVSWNGKDNEGNTVPAGLYQCKISLGRSVIIRSLRWKGDANAPTPKTSPPSRPTRG